MKINQIEIGSFYDWGGYVVKVTGKEQGKIVIVCQEVGEELVKAGSLNKIER